MVRPTNLRPTNTPSANTRGFLLPNTPRMLLVALFGVSGLVSAPMLARAQTLQGGDSQGADAQQYRCLPGTSRCATYRCDPTCRRTGAWERRDYNRGVDGDAPADTSTGGYDRRYDSQASSGYDHRYAQSSPGTQSSSGADGYDERDQGQNGDWSGPGGYGPGGYDQRRDDQQVGASAPTAPGAGYGGGGYGGGGYSGNNYANAYGYDQPRNAQGGEDQDSNGQDSNGQGYDQQTYGQETYQNAPGRGAYGQNSYSQNSYNQGPYGQNRYQQPPVNPPGDAADDDADQGQDYAANAPPPPQPAYRYSGQAQYRCDGYRCAYFRCDPAGDDCHRISGWTSRADADRRPDYDGW